MRVGRAGLGHPTSRGRYGEVVGNLPAVSSASRCALSLASCEAFSFDLNLPLGAAPCGELEVPFGAAPCGKPDGVSGVDVLVCEVVVAAPLDAAPNTVAPTAPPPSSDAAIAVANMPLRSGLMVTSLSLSFPRSARASYQREWRSSEHVVGGLGVRLMSQRGGVVRVRVASTRRQLRR